MFFQSQAWQSNHQALTVAIAAGKAALSATDPHPRSPASAIQRVARSEYWQLESEGQHPERWLIELKRMDPRHVGRFVEWDNHWKCWLEGGDFAVSGETLLSDAAFWLSQGWDLSRSPRDRKTYLEDPLILERDPSAISRIEKSVMPLEGEILRRTFGDLRRADAEQMTFEVWRAQKRNLDDPCGILFHWAFFSADTGDLYAKSDDPIPNHELEGFVAPAYLPREGIERRLIKKAHLLGEAV